MTEIKQRLDTLASCFDRSTAQELLKIFFSQYKESKTEFKIFLQSKDYEKAQALAHKLKSSAVNVGAKEMGTLYALIEKSAISHLNVQNLDEMDVHFKKFESEVLSWLRE